MSGYHLRQSVHCSPLQKEMKGTVNNESYRVVRNSKRHSGTPCISCSTGTASVQRQDALVHHLRNSLRNAPDFSWLWRSSNRIFRLRTFKTATSNSRRSNQIIFY